MRQICGLNSQKATGDHSLGEMVSYLGEELVRSEVVMVDDVWKELKLFWGRM